MSTIVMNEIKYKLPKKAPHPEQMFDLCIYPYQQNGQRVCYYRDKTRCNGCTFLLRTNGKHLPHWIKSINEQELWEVEE